MKLECAGSLASPNAAEADIRRAFEDDSGRGEFVILSESDQVFIQALGEGEGPYMVEYRDGGDDKHYQSAREVSKAEVEAAFCKYLNRDPSWLTDFQWKKLEFKKRWWKFW